MEMIRRGGMPILLCTLLSPQVSAQSPLDEALKAARKENVPWVLVHRSEDSPGYDTQRDESLFRLKAENQMARMPLSAQASMDLWQSRGWGNQNRWLLVSAKGEDIGEGVGLPDGEKVLGMLKAKGLVPRWETRRAFLKLHPENGDAWQEEILQASAVAEWRMDGLLAAGKAARGTIRLIGTELPSIAFSETDPLARERQADLVFGELAEALGGLKGLEGWWRELIFSPRRILLCGGADSPRIREISGSLAQALERTIVRSGPEFRLDWIWPEYQALAGKPMEELPSIQPLPAGEWPPVALMVGSLETLKARKNWEGVLTFLDSLPPPDPRDPWTPQTWKSRRETQAFIAIERCDALLELGNPAGARKSLEDARTWAGTDWGMYAKDGPSMFGAKLSSEKFIKEILQSAPLPDPPLPPPIPPFRLVLLGEPSWRTTWKNLQGSEALLPWGPGERQWISLPPQEAAALRVRNGWGSEPRWAVLAGDALVATGVECPNPGVLAAALEQHGPSRLQRLNAILDRYPNRVDARLARIGLLMARMPEPRLENLLAEDAQAAYDNAPQGAGSLNFSPDAPWKPNAILWQGAAQKTLPWIEQDLRSWPHSTRLWKAWLAWARFHPSRPSVMALANGLTPWATRAVWIGNLPLEVHQAVANELRNEKNYPEMARWLGDAWASVVKASTLPDTWGWVKPEQEKARAAIVAPLAEALRILKRDAEAKKVETTFAEIMKR